MAGSLETNNVHSVSELTEMPKNSTFELPFPEKLILLLLPPHSIQSTFSIDCDTWEIMNEAEYFQVL